LNRWKRVIDLIEDDILAENIINGNKLLLKKGETLDKLKINQLIKLGIEWVCVETLDFPDVVDLEDKGLKPLLNHEIIDYAKRKISDVVKDINEEERFDSKMINELSEVIFESIAANYKEDVFLNLVKLKNYDEYTFTHQLNVSILSTLISLEMEIEKDKIKKITFSSLIHDVGKLKVPLSILNAPRSLTSQEFEAIKSHPIIGEKIALNSGINDELILAGILQHHERISGNGYPYGLKGDRISLLGRIIAVADVYDALTTNRPYKKAWSPYNAMSNLIQSVSIFDSRVMSSLIRIFGIYPPGTRLTLSNGQKCVVVGTKKGKIYRPLVFCSDGKIIDLSERKDLNIVEVG